MIDLEGATMKKGLVQRTFVEYVTEFYSAYEKCHSCHKYNEECLDCKGRKLVVASSGKAIPPRKLEVLDREYRELRDREKKWYLESIGWMPPNNQ
jgi:hypothetical protein